MRPRLIYVASPLIHIRAAIASSPNFGRGVEGEQKTTAGAGERLLEHEALKECSPDCCMQSKQIEAAT